MLNGSRLSAAVLSVPLALGIAVAGWFVGNALYRARASDRFVIVKGFAER
jgi:hypothetical protein